MDKIIGIGNALVDVLAVLKDEVLLQKMNLPKGSMQLIDDDKLMEIKKVFALIDTSVASGGSAGNAMMALGQLRAEPGFIGKIGTDQYGAFFQQACVGNSVTAELLTSNDPSGIASIFITPDCERTFATCLGAAATLTATDITPALFEGYSYLFVEGYLVQNHAMITKAIETAKAMQLQVCLDLSSYNVIENDLAFFKELIDNHVDIVFANELEATALTGLPPREAVDEIAKNCSIAIVKLGAEGSIIRKGTEKIEVGTEQVSPLIDTTGAGDYYAAGFLYGLTNHFSLRKCALIGGILAAQVIQVAGTTLPPSTWSIIRERIDFLLD